MNWLTWFANLGAAQGLILEVLTTCRAEIAKRGP